jgi:hypothetical protein
MDLTFAIRLQRTHRFVHGFVHGIVVKPPRLCPAVLIRRLLPFALVISTEASDPPMISSAAGN